MTEAGPREIHERNRTTRDRFRALGSRLSDVDLARRLDPSWTVSGLMAHTAFWDRYVLARWQLAATAGTRTPRPIEDDALDLINDASIPQWNVVPPRLALEGCLSAAEELDGFLTSLDVDVVEELIRDGRDRLVDRSLHRAEHLETIEAAFLNR
jgi:hypothetical protein